MRGHHLLVHGELVGKRRRQSHHRHPVRRAAPTGRIGAHHVNNRFPQRLLGVSDLELGFEKGDAAFDVTGHAVLAHHHLLHHAHHGHAR